MKRLSHPFGVFATLVLLVLPALAQEAPRSPTPRDSRLPARQVDVARGLEHPWGLVFLPDGRMLVTERPGRLRLVGPDGRPDGLIYLLTDNPQGWIVRLEPTPGS